MFPPDVGEYEDWLQAFWYLSDDRQSGMAVGRIPFTAINEYAKRIDMSDEEFWHFLEAIRAMDTAFIETVTKKP
jgi:hypothetical protein